MGSSQAGNAQATPKGAPKPCGQRSLASTSLWALKPEPPVVSFKMSCWKQKKQQKNTPSCDRKTHMAKTNISTTMNRFISPSIKKKNPIHLSDHSKWWFPKMVGFPNNHWFFLLNMIMTWGVKWGYHHLRKHQYGSNHRNWGWCPGT